jgi:prepilin-type N-terminal cleavage/methylation domain-containing protein
MTTLRQNQPRAFTLIELLVVIAIMGIVAALIVWGAGRASEARKISRTQVERERLVTLIEAYKLKLGFYPPQNVNNPEKNTLIYELAGAIKLTGPPYSDGNPGFQTPFGTVSSNEIYSALGMTNIINAYTLATDDITEFKRFLKNLKPDEFVTEPNGVKRFVVPVDGTDLANPRPNYWNYLAGTNEVGKAVRNPEAFDLWVNVRIRGIDRTIGNWKE